MSMDDVVAFAAARGIDTRQLATSYAMAETFLAELRPMLVAEFPLETLPGLELVVIGSIAKRQCTRGSDLDFFAIAEAPLPPERTETVLRAMFAKATASGFDAPFSQGITGVVVPRAEIEQLHVITDDTRKRFRRMTMLTASVSAYRPTLRRDIARGLVDAMIGRDRTPRVRGLLDYLMLNVRLGNLIAEWMRSYPPPDGGHVNWAKCFTLYRIEYVSAFVAMIRADETTRGRSRADLVEAVITELERPPLERLVAWYDDLSDVNKEAVAEMIAVSNDTLAIFARDGVRAWLAQGGDDSQTTAILDELDVQMAKLRGAIAKLLLRTGPFERWIEHVGLFG